MSTLWDFLSSDWSKNQAQLPSQDRQDAPMNDDYDDMAKQIDGIDKVAGAANDVLKEGGDLLSGIGEAFKGFANIGLGLGGSATSTATLGDIEVNSGSGFKVSPWLVGAAVILGGIYLWRK